MLQVYALCEEDVLDENRLCELMACGFSRIPIHSKRARCDIRGFLLVKRLIILGKGGAGTARHGCHVVAVMSCRGCLPACAPLTIRRYACTQTPRTSALSRRCPSGSPSSCPPTARSSR